MNHMTDPSTVDLSHTHRYVAARTSAHTSHNTNASLNTDTV